MNWFYAAVFAILLNESAGYRQCSQEEISATGSNQLKCYESKVWKNYNEVVEHREKVCAPAFGGNRCVLYEERNLPQGSAMSSSYSLTSSSSSGLPSSEFEDANYYQGFADRQRQNQNRVQEEMRRQQEQMRKTMEATNKKMQDKIFDVKKQIESQMSRFFGFPMRETSPSSDFEYAGQNPINDDNSSSEEPSEEESTSSEKDSNSSEGSSEDDSNSSEGSSEDDSNSTEGSSEDDSNSSEGSSEEENTFGEGSSDEDSERPPDDGTLNQRPSDDGTLNQRPSDDGTLNQRPSDDGTLNQRPSDDGTLNQRPSDDGTLNQRPSDDGTLNQRPSDDGTLNQRPSDDGTLNETLPSNDENLGESWSKKQSSEGSSNGTTEGLVDVSTGQTIIKNKTDGTDINLNENTENTLNGLVTREPSVTDESQTNDSNTEFSNESTESLKNSSDTLTTDGINTTESTREGTDGVSAIDWSKQSTTESSKTNSMKENGVTGPDFTSTEASNITEAQNTTESSNENDSDTISSLKNQIMVAPTQFTPPITISNPYEPMNDVGSQITGGTTQTTVKPTSEGPTANDRVPPETTTSSPTTPPPDSSKNLESHGIILTLLLFSTLYFGNAQSKF